MPLGIFIYFIQHMAVDNNLCSFYSEQKQNNISGKCILNISIYRALSIRSILQCSYFFALMYVKL